MAVYTHITAEDLKKHLAHFDIGALVSFEGITEGIENTNYKLVTTQGAFILTLFEKRVRAEDLPFFTAFMEHLRQGGIPCPEVMAGKDGRRLIPFNGQPAVILSFLEGQWPKKIEAFHVGAVGKTLAEMHRLGAAFSPKRENTMSLLAWKTLLSACTGHELLPFLQEELDYLEKNWPLNLPAGAIHADLFPDNIFFKNDKLIGIIDFYFSCTDVFAYDLMLALNAWCFTAEGVADPQKTTALQDAYQKKRPLSIPEQKSLPFLGRAAAVRIIATRLYDSLHPVAGAVVNMKDPMEYVRILKFHQSQDFQA